jgi:hypothetical protein
MFEQIAKLSETEAKGNYIPIYISALAILIISELIGSFSISIGPGKVILLPMIWALFLGAALGLWTQKSASRFAITLPQQTLSSRILQPALLIFIAKLGLVVGSSLPAIIHSGWALAFQELGHFVGTIIIALPIALILGIKREAIGATFSVGREPSLAIIGEKYGMNSPEGRGVLAEYLTGTIFGAIFIALVAGFITSLGVFDPRSLAMAAGVGSGSMMAAAAGAIAAQVDKTTSDTVMALAAASNLITTTIGTYFTLFISLPLAVKTYHWLEPVLGRHTRAAEAPAVSEDKTESAESDTQHAGLSWLEKVIAWFATTVLCIIGNWIVTGTFSVVVLGAGLVLISISILGDTVYQLTGKKVPAVCWVSFIAMFATSPWCPWAVEIAATTKTIGVMPIITPMLTFAGLSIAKDLPAFRKLGWRIILVSFIANFGTFIGAALIAELLH